jgi:hypothetical protein
VQAPAKAVVARLDRTHVLHGRVTDPSGAPQPHAKIFVTATGAEASRAVSVWVSAADGRYAIDGFAPGTFLVWAQRDDRATYPPMRVSLERDDLEPLELELRLDHEGALVTGHVVDQDGHPVYGAYVELEPRWPLALPVPLGAESGHDGKFAVDGLMPGRYALSVRQGARALSQLAGPREVQVPIEEGEEVDLDEKVQVRTRVE